MPVILPGGKKAPVAAANDDRKSAIVTAKNPHRRQVRRRARHLRWRKGGAAMQPMRSGASWCAACARHDARAASPATALAQLRNERCRRARGHGRAVERVPVVVHAHHVRPLRQGADDRRDPPGAGATCRSATSSLKGATTAAAVGQGADGWRPINRFAAGIATASVLMLGACDLSAYPCRGPYGEPCGGPRSGWPGAASRPNCEKFGGPTWSTSLSGRPEHETGDEDAGRGSGAE